jgi:hypothetical protein
VSRTHVLCGALVGRMYLFVRALVYPCGGLSSSSERIRSSANLLFAGTEQGRNKAHR